MSKEIKQVKNGRQPRPYADHVWEWLIITNEPEEEVLSFCRKELKDALREETDYWKDYRDNSKSFNEHMEVVCGGYFSLKKISGGYVYRVTQEYID